MNPDLINNLEHCSQASFSGELTFPQIVERLSSIGIERYHADYTRREKTYYFANGDSHVVAFGPIPYSIGREFRADEVIAAIKQSQQNEHTYEEFIARTMKAGCVGYFVQITGKRALYFGRQGEIHTELFPAPVASQP